MTKIVSIQYPSGGFGHFVHAILSSYGAGFQGNAVDYKFGPGGNSHAFPLMLPKYYNKTFNIEKYQKRLDKLTTAFATLLIDSGIDNDSDEYRSLIQPDLTIQISYDDWSWPLLARMFYTRCMSAVRNKKQIIDDWVKPCIEGWNTPDAIWAQREKFFLYLRDHHFRHMWKPKHNSLIIPIEHILNYNSLYNSLNSLVEVSEFKDLYQNWYNTNEQYFNFYNDAKNIIHNVDSDLDIKHITDVFTQSTVYYYIWLKYNFEVPHNDYASWFTNTKDIAKMLNDHGVTVDSY
jgi:hypothetical protein